MQVNEVIRQSPVENASSTGSPNGAAIAVALDGPAAAGKTVVGRLLARKLGCRFLDTGVMYRAITWAALEAGVDPKDAAGLQRLVQETPIELVFNPEGDARVLVGGKDATPHLWDARVGQNVSLVSQAAGLREVLVAQQRRLAQDGGIIMAGRDIGTVVLPHATAKVFLTASPQERARRRHAEMEARGDPASYEEVLAEVQRRDKMDSERKVSPLRPAPDAQVVVTDGMSIEQVASFLLALVMRRR
ncbi:MAG: (d)CMP kinase [Chloroflexi bacterium]|nr:(d)CMP kinase [Chloroflexota bacterium]